MPKKYDDQKWQRDVVELLVDNPGLDATKLRRMLVGEPSPGSDPRVEELRDGIFPSTRTMQAWVQHFQMYGETPADSTRRKRRRRSDNCSVETGMQEEHLGVLKRLWLENPSWFAGELAAALNKELKREGLISNSEPGHSDATVWRALTSKRGLNLSYKQLRYVAAEANKAAQCEFADRMLDVDPARVMWVDETHKGHGNKRPVRAYRPRGLTVTELERLRKESNYTVIAAMDWRGFVDQACLLLPQG